MSGQKNKTPSDVIKHRQEYLDNLSLQVQLNEANEQAVKQFVSTGQVPPISQMKDTRSTTQILLDVEKLKINLIKDLEPIADPQFAQQIVQRIIQSPLNVDNKLLIFTAQRIEELVLKLKKLYKYGIKGDANDAENFVSFINKFYTDKDKLTIGVKEYMNRLGSDGTTGSSKAIKQSDSIRNTLAEYTIIYHKIQNLKGEIPRNSAYLRQQYNRMYAVSNTVILKLDSLLEIIPINDSYLANLENVLIKVSGLEGYNEFSNAVSQYLDFLNHSVPNLSYIQSLLIELTNSVNTAGQIFKDDIAVGIYTTHLNKIKAILYRIDSVLALDENDIERIKQTRIDINRYLREEREPVEEAGEAKEQDEPFLGILPAGGHDFRENIEPDNPPVPVPVPVQMNAVEDPGDYEQYTAADREDVIKVPLNRNIDKIVAHLANPNLLMTPAQRNRIEAAVRGINLIYNDPNATPAELIVALERSRNILPRMGDITGTGIKPRMKGRGLTRADYTQGIEPSARYIKFGRYMINNKKLNDNILSLRRSKGSMVSSIPATKMTSQLGNVFKKIVGGGIPSYDELNSLTDAEKRYLYKVSQEADIYDKIKIPTPNKDEEEKDVHLFNVMKGEIMAGNNSKELISKFKVLLNKLSRTNVLPKSQVREILEELLELGY